MSFADTLVLTPNQNVAARGTHHRRRAEATCSTARRWARRTCGDASTPTRGPGRTATRFDGDRGASLETLTVRLRRGPIVLPKLTLLSLYLDGGEPAVLRLSRAAGSCRWRASTTPPAAITCWRPTPSGRSRSELTCRPEDMLHDRVRRSRRRARLLPQHRVRRRARHRVAAQPVRRPLPRASHADVAARARTSSGRRAPAIRWCKKRHVAVDHP